MSLGNKIRWKFISSSGRKWRIQGSTHLVGPCGFVHATFCLNRFHFQELCVSSCWSRRISSISVKMSEVIWKKAFNPSANFIQLIFSQLPAFKILFFGQLPLHFSLHTRSYKNTKLHDGQFRKYRICTDSDYIKGIRRGSYWSVASAQQKSWRSQIYRRSRRGKSLDKLSDNTGKASTFMLVTLKVSHSELLDLESQIRGNRIDSRRVMEPSCLKR
jgi:hypothetical protein